LIVRYYFVEGHALNDKPRLAQVAAETVTELLAKQNATDQALSEEEILSFLHGNEGRLEIENALRALRKLGVHGIPKFIIEGSSVIDGAAGPETFVKVFREIEKRGYVSGGPIFGDILDVSKETWMKGSHTRESFLLNEDVGWSTS
jgi:predicted DsbA family dithiol-disulfide isomerase